MTANAILAFDTSTAATVVGLAVDGVLCAELADRPQDGERPRHAERLLELCEEALTAGGLSWAQLSRVGVGIGPGTFTGLRIGAATAQGLAQAVGVELAALSSLEALALAARRQYPQSRIAAVADARRGEAYVACWEPDGRQTVEAQACAPPQLAALLAAGKAPVIAIGEGALIFRQSLESAAISVPDSDSALHNLAGGTLCQLAAGAEPSDGASLIPQYIRRPDAEIALEARTVAND